MRNVKNYKFMKGKFNIIARREQFNLSLRKAKIESFINEKRLKTQNFSKLKIGLSPFFLNVNEKLKNLNFNDLVTIN